MRFNPRRTIPCLGLAAALAFSAGATAAEPVEVTVPFTGTTQGFSAAGGGSGDPGCWHRNTIAYSQATDTPTTYRVRHFGRTACDNVNERIRCRAELFLGGTTAGEPISTIASSGRNRCSMASEFQDSATYPENAQFTERYRLRYTLVNRGKRWDRDSLSGNFCKISNEARTLTCGGTHRGEPPVPDTAAHG